MNTSAIFVGVVRDLTSVKHPVKGMEGAWTAGYSMRFAVEEPLRAMSAEEVLVETGSGAGDCGTPLEPGTKVLIFAYRNSEDGKLWTGMCSGNQMLSGGPNDEKILEPYRALAKTQTGSISGIVTTGEPSWSDTARYQENNGRFLKDVVLHAKSDGFTATAKTNDHGAFEFNELPKGKYTVVPDIASGMEVLNKYEGAYEADVGNGSCQKMSFHLEPTTRIHGHLELPEGFDKGVQVVALPISIENPDEFGGKWNYTNKDGDFDLWPMPTGDYYVGVNINRAPKEDSPFLPTYYPGVSDRANAVIVHVATGETKELDLNVKEFAVQRKVHFTAIGPNGVPLRRIDVQVEDLQHPGRAMSLKSVDLDEKGAGVVTIYEGASYHLHGNNFLGAGNDWCSAPIVVPAGTKDVEGKFVVDRKMRLCNMSEIDGLK